MTTKLYNIVLLFLWLPAALMVGNNDGPKYDKTKTIKKEFSVNSNAKLDINNKYGDVNILSWNENRIMIEVNVIVSGTDQSKVEERLNAITVEFQGSQSFVSAKTHIEKLRNSWGKNNSIHFKINYTVKMPLTNHLQVYNDYGAIYLNELKGEATLNCDYGNVFVGELLNSSNEINLDYCNGSTIRSMKGGEINADYSKFHLGNGGEIKLVADYSTSEFENVGDLNYNCDYGSLRVENGNVVVGVSDYLPAKFGKINTRLHAESDYGSVQVGSLSDQFESVKINADYCAIKLGVPNTAFRFNLELSYSGFRYDGSQYEFTHKIEKSTTKLYEGYYKSANNKASIEISSSYGSVTFN